VKEGLLGGHLDEWEEKEKGKNLFGKM